MDLSVGGYVTRESRYIRGDQLAQGSKIQDRPNNGVTFPQSKQDFFRCRVLSGFGFFGFGIEFEFVEQQFADLLGTVDIESLAGEAVNLLLQLIEFLCENGFSLFEFVHIDTNTGGFHLTQYRH